MEPSGTEPLSIRSLQHRRINVFQLAAQEQDLKNKDRAQPHCRDPYITGGIAADVHVSACPHTSRTFTIDFEVFVDDLNPEIINLLSWLRAEEVLQSQLSVFDRTQMGNNSAVYTVLKLTVNPDECSLYPDGRFAGLLKALLTERLWVGRWDMPLIRPVTLQGTDTGGLVCKHIDADIILNGIATLGRKVGFQATYGKVVQNFDDREERKDRYLAQGRTWYGDDEEPELPEPNSGPKIEWTIEKEPEEKGKSKGDPEGESNPEPAPVNNDAHVSEADFELSMEDYDLLLAKFPTLTMCEIFDLRDAELDLYREKKSASTMAKQKRKPRAKPKPEEKPKTNYMLF